MRVRTQMVIVGLLASAGCSSKLEALNHTEGPADNPDERPVDPTGATDTEPPAGDPGTDPGAPTTDTDNTSTEVPTTPTDTGTPAPPAEPTPVRFIAMGDGGTGDAEQYEVAAAIEQVCLANGCDFAIYSGDNIYSDGVSDVYDDQFVDKFEDPYQYLGFPFYMALGNHDWHQGQAGADAQVAYTAYSTKWRMPATYYSFAWDDVTFFALDTNSLKDGDPSQESFFQSEVPAATTTWKIAFGHHPYLSNGDHGDTGGDLETYFDDHLCGNIDIYFCGHDHDLQWLEPQCGTEFVVSGAAAKLRDVGGGHPTFFETSTYGFMWVEILGNQMTGVFYDSNGTELYRRSFTK
jgi:tartrate-resistant acid phosphatase type 5